MPSPRPLKLAKIELDSGDEHLASVEVEHPSRTYEGRMLDWGFVDRSISVPSGEYQGGDSRIRVADTDLEKRDLLAVQTALRRRYSAKLVNDGESESAKEPFIVHEIKDFERGPGYLDFVGRDAAFTWTDKKIPGLGNRTNFPYAMDGVDEFFIPILFGHRISTSDASPPTPQGIVTLPQITRNRWIVAQHLVVDVSFMRRNPGEDGFTLVDPSEYIVFGTGETYDGIFYEITILEFNDIQPVDCEIRLHEFRGLYARPAFGSLPEISPSSPIQELRNPIDLLVTVQNRGLAGELNLPDFDTDSFLETWERFEVLLGGSPAQGYKMDCAIVEPTTIREFIGLWCRNVEADYKASKSNKITVSVAQESDPERPVLSDGPIFGEPTDNSLILIDSFRERPANPCVTRLLYNYEFNFATKKFAEKQIFDNLADQATLAGPTSARPGIIEGTLDLPLLSDVNTVIDVVERRMAFLGLGSYRIEVTAPLVETEELELGQMVGITRYDGLEVGGHHNREFKITGLTDDLNSLIRTIRGVLRVPISFALLFCPLNALSTCEAYSQFLTAPGIVNPTWAIVGGSLPEGLTLNASTGEISGTPTNSGTYNYTARAFDASTSPATPYDIECQLDVWTCIPDMVQHPTLETLDSEDFDSSPSPWTPVRHDHELDFDSGDVNNTHPQISTLIPFGGAEGGIVSQRYLDTVGSNSSTDVGYIYSPAEEWPDWECHAIWGGDGRDPAPSAPDYSPSPSMTVAGPISMNPDRLISNPEEADNPEVKYLRFYGWECRHLENPNGIHATDSYYQFTLVKVFDGTVENIGNPAPGYDLLPGFPRNSYLRMDDFTGHEFSIRCLCIGHGDGRCVIIQGLIDGVVANTSIQNSILDQMPDGKPGIGNLYQQLDEVQDDLINPVFARVQGHFWADRLNYTDNFSVRIVSGLAYAGMSKIQPCPLWPGTRSVTYQNFGGGSLTARMSAFGGRRPYRWTLISGALPDGLTFDNSRIVGIPTESGTFNFTVRVRDKFGATATASCSITIGTLDPVQIVTTCPLTDANRGTPYEEILEAEDGLEPYTWDISAGALPGGLTLSSGGIISGTPTAEGVFSFTLRVTDSDQGQTDTVSCQITVDPPLPLEITTTCPLTSGAVDIPYSGGFAATGGVPPYTWTMTSGALPDGLTFNSDGTITGTPTEDGTFTVEATVMDSQSPADSDTLECNLDITGDAGDFSGITQFRLIGAQVIDDAVDTIYSGTGVTIDTADLPGASTAYLAVVARNANVSTNFMVDLVDETESVVATVTITPTSTNRLLAIDELSSFGDHTYSLKVRSTSDFDLTIEEALLVVPSASGDRVRLSFPLLFGVDSSGGGLDDEQQNIDSAWCRSVSGGSAYAANEGCRIFLKNDANFATIAGWAINVAAIPFSGSPGTGSGWAALFNATDNAMVAGAEVEFPDTTVNMSRQVATFTNSATNFGSGKEFEPRFKGDAGVDLGVAMFDLEVFLNPALKGECHLLIAGPQGIGTTSAVARQEMRYKHEPTLFTTGTTFLFEMTAKEVGGSSSAFMSDVSTADSGVAGASDVSGSQLDFSTSVRERKRSGALTLTNGNRYLFRPASSSGQTIRQAGGVIIAVVPEA